MNLADSVKFVLKSKSPHLMRATWGEDLRNLLKESKSDVTHLLKSGKRQLKEFQKDSLKVSVDELKDSLTDAVTILKLIPKRVKEGFSYFREDFVTELENLPDQRQKTVFCLKVIGALSSFIIGAIYNIRMGRSDLTFMGIKRKNAFTQFLIAELILKTSQFLILRFLTEVEKQVEDPDELNNLRYFKALLSDREMMETEREKNDFAESGNDPSITLVEDLRTFIMTGKRES